MNVRITIYHISYHTTYCSKTIFKQFQTSKQSSTQSSTISPHPSTSYIFIIYPPLFKDGNGQFPIKFFFSKKWWSSSKNSSFKVSNPSPTISGSPYTWLNQGQAAESRDPSLCVARCAPPMLARCSSRRRLCSPGIFFRTSLLYKWWYNNHLSGC